MKDLTCLRCENKITRGTAYYEVNGYETPRIGGGTNHLTLRKRTGRVLCTPCVHLAKGGITQDDLFSTPGT